MRVAGHRVRCVKSLGDRLGRTRAHSARLLRQIEAAAQVDRFQQDGGDEGENRRGSRKDTVELAAPMSFSGTVFCTARMKFCSVMPTPIPTRMQFDREAVLVDLIIQIPPALVAARENLLYPRAA
jgi:hypothetical protein